MLTLLFTIVPPILILLFFVLTDRFKEPKITIITVFFLGFLICLPAGILNQLSHDFFFNKLPDREPDRIQFVSALTLNERRPAWATKNRADLAV